MLRVSATARMEPTTDAAPLIAQAQLTRRGSAAPACATIFGKTAPSGMPSPADAITATAPRAGSGQASVIAATHVSTTRRTETATAQTADAWSGSSRSFDDQLEPMAAPINNAA